MTNWVRSVAVTGIAVLAGFTRISDPFVNFHNIWQGSTTNPNALATALVKTNFAYFGWSTAFNLLGEINGTNPVRTVRNAGFISLGVVTILFLTVNFSYIRVYRSRLWVSICSSPPAFNNKDWHHPRRFAKRAFCARLFVRSSYPTL